MSSYRNGNQSELEIIICTSLNEQYSPFDSFNVFFSFYYNFHSYLFSIFTFRVEKVCFIYVHGWEFIQGKIFFFFCSLHFITIKLVRIITVHLNIFLINSKHQWFIFIAIRYVHVKWKIKYVFDFQGTRIGLVLRMRNHSSVFHIWLLKKHNKNKITQFKNFQHNLGLPKSNIKNISYKFLGKKLSSFQVSSVLI